MAKHYGPAISQAYIDKLKQQPGSRMNVLLKECMKKITRPQKLTKNNFRRTVDIIESYIYTVFSIDTGLTTLPDDAAKIAALNIAQYALKIPDEKLRRSFVAAFGLKIGKSVLKTRDWDKLYNERWAKRYEKRRDRILEELNIYSGPVTVQGLELPDPNSITAAEAEILGEAAKDLIIATNNPNQIKPLLKHILHWTVSIEDDFIMGSFLKTITIYEAARIKMLSEENWTFAAKLIKPRI